MIRKAVYACIVLHFTRKCVKKITYPATKTCQYNNMVRRIIAISEKIRLNSVYGATNYVITTSQKKAKKASMSVSDMYPHVMTIFPKTMETPNT